MSTATISPSRMDWVRGKYLFFAFFGLMLGYGFWHNESFLFNAQDPEWQHIATFRWYLLPHGIAGACALLLAPMQFSDRLRRRFANVAGGPDFNGLWVLHGLRFLQSARVLTFSAQLNMHCMRRQSGVNYVSGGN
jgi:hypothetical protein